VFGDGATVQAGTRRLLTATAWVQFHVSSCKIFGEECHCASFPPGALVSPANSHSTKRSISLIYYQELVKWAIYGLSTKGADLKNKK
jgi:hypothetical protein